VCARGLFAVAVQFNRRMDEWINEHEIVRQGTDEGNVRNMTTLHERLLSMLTLGATSPL
jgi:hypothetical protein